MGSKSRILFVDDDPNETVLVEMAVRKLQCAIQVSSVGSGEEALQYLQGQGRYCDPTEFPFPDLIISDLKMPRMSGVDLLVQVRARWGSLPFVIFSNSGVQGDVDHAYRAGASSYLKKPTDFNGLVELFKAICEYWSRCEQPTRLKVALAKSSL